MPCIMQCRAVTHWGVKAAGQGHTQHTGDFSPQLHAVLAWGPQEATALQSLVLYQLLLARLWQQQTVMYADRSVHKTQDPLSFKDCHKAPGLHSSLGTTEEDLMPWPHQRRTGCARHSRRGLDALATAEEDLVHAGGPT